MRTTLDIDSDVLSAAKERARREGKTAGEVVSELLRQALNGGPETTGGSSMVRESPSLYGFSPLPSGGAIVTNAMIDQLRHDDAY